MAKIPVAGHPPGSIPSQIVYPEPKAKDMHFRLKLLHWR